MPVIALVVPLTFTVAPRIVLVPALTVPIVVFKLLVILISVVPRIAVVLPAVPIVVFPVPDVLIFVAPNIAVVEPTTPIDVFDVPEVCCKSSIYRSKGRKSTIN